jgi:hypothetical protein
MAGGHDPWSGDWDEQYRGTDAWLARWNAGPWERPKHPGWVVNELLPDRYRRYWDGRRYTLRERQVDGDWGDQQVWDGFGWVDEADYDPDEYERQLRAARAERAAARTVRSRHGETVLKALVVVVGLLAVLAFRELVGQNDREAACITAAVAAGDDPADCVQYPR